MRDLVSDTLGDHYVYRISGVRVSDSSQIEAVFKLLPLVSVEGFLKIRGVTIGSSQLDLLSELDQIEYLSILDCNFEEGWTSGFKLPDNLRIFRCNSPTLNDSIVDSINSSKVTELRLRGTSFSDAGLKRLHSPVLRYLVIAETNISQLPSFNTAQNLPALETLIIDRGMVTKQEIMSFELSTGINVVESRKR